MGQDNKDNDSHRQEDVYSKRLRAGKRRTYFFDVRTTKSNDYYLTITESKKRFDDDGYDRHKLFLYKEDFNKFITALTETVDHVKKELLPDFDFDSFTRDDDDYKGNSSDDNQTIEEIKADAIVDEETDENDDSDSEEEDTEGNK